MNNHTGCLVAQFFELQQIRTICQVNRLWKSILSTSTVWNYIPTLRCSLNNPTSVNGFFCAFKYVKRVNIQLNFAFCLERPLGFLLTLAYLEDLYIHDLNGRTPLIRSWNLPVHRVMRKFEVNWWNLSWYDVSFILDRFPGLTALQLPALVGNISGDLKNITSLGYHCYLPAVLDSLSEKSYPYLTELQLFGFTGDAVYIGAYFAKFPSLTSLHVPICNLEHLRMIFHCTNPLLEILSIEASGLSQSFTLCPFIDLLSNFATRIKKLTLYFNSKAFTLADYLPQLSKLLQLQDLEIHKGLIDETIYSQLSALFSPFKSLRECRCLDFFSINGLSVNQLCPSQLSQRKFELPDKLGNLRYLAIDSVAKVFY